MTNRRFRHALNPRSMATVCCFRKETMSPPDGHMSAQQYLSA
jgi:hypothetical protein